MLDGVVPHAHLVPGGTACLAFARQSFSHERISINLNAEYRIEIDAKNKIPLDTLGCLLGNGMRSTCAVP